MVLNFEKEKLEKELKKIKPKKVLIQLPEGIKQNAFDILSIFKKLKIETIFSGETCWGGCSLAIEEAKSVGADLIVHFGHAKFMKTNFPVLYIEIRDEINIIPLLKKSISKLKDFNNIGLSCSIQHIHDLKKIKQFYEKNGKKVILSKKKGNVAYEGHLVGCQYSGLKAIEDKADCFVIIGNNFHSMGASLVLNKPVFLIDVYNSKIKDMEGTKDKILRQRILSVEKFKKAKKIGIIIETKLGQKFGSLEVLKNKLEKKGKKIIPITMNEISPDKLTNFRGIDAFIELACPRIAIDDFTRYPKPIITFREALVAIGEKSWEEIIKEGLM